MYFYNETSMRCQNFRWSGCDEVGVFSTLYQCASACNTGQGAPFCAKSPPGACNETSSGRKRTRYFYNVTSKSCSKYDACDNVRSAIDMNSFAHLEYCRKQCEGFTEENANGTQLSETHQ
ncbi:hypothetical protein MTO96_033494 [Rhipicephalus appendiculatus]